MIRKYKDCSLQTLQSYHFQAIIMDTFYSLSSETNLKCSGGGQKVNGKFFFYNFYIIFFAKLGGWGCSTDIRMLSTIWCCQNNMKRTHACVHDSD